MLELATESRTEAADLAGAMPIIPSHAAEPGGRQPAGQALAGAGLRDSAGLVRLLCAGRCHGALGDTSGPAQGLGGAREATLFNSRASGTARLAARPPSAGGGGTWRPSAARGGRRGVLAGHGARVDLEDGEHEAVVGVPAHRVALHPHLLPPPPPPLRSRGQARNPPGPDPSLEPATRPRTQPAAGP